jgi:hypothetical protein
MSDILTNELQSLKEKIEAMQIAQLKLEEKRKKHNQICLNYYNAHKDTISQVRKERYQENAEALRAKRRERYRLIKEQHNKDQNIVPTN